MSGPQGAVVRRRGRSMTSVRIAAVWLAYSVFFLVFHDIVNDIAAIAVAWPIVYTARELGLRGGIGAAVLLWPIQIGLFMAADHGLGWDMVAGPQGLFGFVVMAFAAILVGWVGERARTFEAMSNDKDLLLTTVSHEVKNPLTGVIGMAEILASNWETLDPGEGRELAGLIASEGHQVAAIIDDLLAAARLGAGTMVVESQPIELLGLVDAVVNQHGVPVESAVGVPVTAVGDPARIRQILRNLLMNADRHGGGDQRVVLGADGRTVWIEVLDDGPGVPPEIEPHLFHPFVSGGHHESTGLGLAVSRNLARAMGGDLLYRRQDGLTVFRLELPAASSSLSQVPA